MLASGFDPTLAAADRQEEVDPHMSVVLERLAAKTQSNPDVGQPMCGLVNTVEQA